MSIEETDEVELSTMKIATKLIKKYKKLKWHFDKEEDLSPEWAIDISSPDKAPKKRSLTDKKPYS